MPSHAGEHSVASSSGSPMSEWGQKQQGQDKIDQGWSDSMRGQDRVTSPSSGEKYVVPWNAWSETGPQGAGYYRQVPGGGVERMDDAQ